MSDLEGLRGGSRAVRFTLDYVSFALYTNRI